MDLASAIDELYGGAPEEFVERRKALATQARAAKDRALATAIGQLRRPTRSAWLVNLYAREASEELGALLDLGAALQAAQQQLSVADLRRLSGERQQALAAATRTAVRLGDSRGYTATDAVRTEVTQTLQAALADPEVAEQVRAGTVTEAHAYGGFGVFGLGTPTTAGPDPESASEEPVHDDDSQRVEGDRVEAERVEAEQRLHAAEAALGAASDEAEEATARADELAERIEGLRRVLAEVEQTEAEARQQARAARKALSEREADVRSARDAFEAI